MPKIVGFISGCGCCGSIGWGSVHGDIRLLLENGEKVRMYLCSECWGRVNHNLVLTDDTYSITDFEKEFAGCDVNRMQISRRRLGEIDLGGIRCLK
jgi:hypothetical protein